MKPSFWRKRIPTLLGLLIISIAIGATTFLIGKPTFFTGNASPTSTPSQVRITNVSDSGFSVSYMTDSYILGTVNIGKDKNLGQVVTDNKDQGKVKEHKIHNFTVQNLSPSTKYFFSITSGQDNYLNNGVPYEVTTGPELTAKTGAGFIVGKVVNPDGQTPKEGVVFVTTQGAQTLSSDIKPDGSYTTSLEGLRSEDFSTVFNLQNNSQIKLLIVTDLGTSNVVIFSKNINSVPTVIIGHNYDFSNEEGVASPSASLGKFPTVPVGKIQNGPKIISPSDGQSIKDNRPLFSGTALPNNKVTITINSSQTIQTQVVSDSGGNWSFRPSTTLAPGQHSITITSIDSSGIVRTVTQNFTIVQVVEAASPTPTPTPSPTITPLPSTRPLPPATSSATPKPVTSLPTLIPIPSSTPTATLPPTGSSDVSTGFLGIATVAAGLVFLLISKLVL